MSIYKILKRRIGNIRALAHCTARWRVSVSLSQALAYNIALDLGGGWWGKIFVWIKKFMEEKGYGRPKI